MKRFTFKKEERLKSLKVIDQLFSEGHHQFKYPIKLVFKPIEKSTYPIYFTCSVSKRNFKSAVSRNRIKRQIKEAYRLCKLDKYSKLEEAPFSLAMMAIYVGKEFIDYQVIEKSVSVTIDNAIQKSLKKMRHH